MEGRWINWLIANWQINQSKEGGGCIKESWQTDQLKEGRQIDWSKNGGQIDWLIKSQWINWLKEGMQIDCRQLKEVPLHHFWMMIEEKQDMWHTFFVSNAW